MPNPDVNTEPPLVDVKVTNPVTYLKRWWNRIIGNEGVDFRLHIRPLTAILIAVVIASIGFGAGRFVLPFSIPFFKYEPTPIPQLTVDPWRETAFSGKLQLTANRYYLVTTSAEAINLEVPNNIDLSTLVGRRILAAGKYNKTTRTLIVNDALDLEVLPIKPVPVPTILPTPSPTLSPTPIPTPEVTATPETFSPS